MKGDFSRLTFDATKHFSRVLMQQGRVQLDSDWNEQTAIMLHYLQTLAADLIGPYAGPKDNFGLEIKKIDSVLDDFQIGNGRYYVDGILVELQATSVPSEIVQPNGGGMLNKIKVPVLTINNKTLKEGQYLEVFAKTELATTPKLVKITKINTDKSVLTVNPGLNPNVVYEVQQAITYKTQSDYPLPVGENFENNKMYLVYIDLWERHVSYIEDDSIREVALGGSDTATRAKIVWQIKTEVLGNINDRPGFDAENEALVDSQWINWIGKWQPSNRGMLKAQAKQDAKKDTDPCLTLPEASYRDAENQLYRVEIHQGKLQEQSKPTFKWSRDNGSTVTPIIKINGNELTVESIRGLNKDQWLELINENQELRGEPGVLVKITSIDCDTVKFAFDNKNSPAASIPIEPNTPTKARLWNSGEMQIVEKDDGDWIKLEYGVEIQFQPSGDTSPQIYRTGDYWLIPARVATGDVEWPGDEGKPEALPPHGVEHHYAPLAIIGMGEGGLKFGQDLRRQIEPLGKLVPVPVPVP